MKVFVTGASGWVGSAVVPELVAAGHQVVGLARSDASAAAIRSAGAEAARGELDDLDSLQAGAKESDAVIHLANKHDWGNPTESNRAERAAVEALVEALDGTGRPLLIASGVALLTPGRVATELDPNPFSGPDAPRGGSESLALGSVDRGIRPVALRFAPTVHGVADGGFIASIVDVARRTGVSAYIGDGANRWAAVHRADLADLVRRAVEHPDATEGIVHGVAEQGIPTRELASAIGAAFGLPTVSLDPAAAPDHFGWIAAFFGLDLAASSELTKHRLGWEPRHPGLLADIAAGTYGRV